MVNENEHLMARMPPNAPKMPLAQMMRHRHACDKLRYVVRRQSDLLLKTLVYLEHEGCTDKVLLAQIKAEIAR